MLRTDAVLDLAIGKQFDSSTTMRVKALAWLNEAMQRLYLERDWLCLQASTPLAASSNALTKPSGYGRFRYLKSTTSGSEFLLLPKHRLTEEEKFDYTDPNAVDPIPLGFYEGAQSISLLPGYTGTVELGYVKSVPVYTDNVVTLWDDKFLLVLSRSVQSCVYEYESDQAGVISLQLDQVELKRLKAEENRQKPIPQRTKYLRGRL